MRQPHTLATDQAEEIYTRPNAALPDEMRDFLDVLVALFGVPAQRPQGRLILSFRKEWLAEIEKLLAERQLPRTKVFLQRLEKRGIVEAVTGPARSPRLQQHFGLAVANDLDGEIADDLLADPSSTVAPTLQILLSKMWRQAKARDYDRPIFSGALYQELRRQGLLLSDFLDQQLATLHGAQPAATESGLALDLLAFHTTPMGTAEQRTQTELRAAYAHQAVTLPDLLATCRDLYLLVDPAENHPDAEPSSRVAHDTLAPLVRHRFEISEKPGQRARRILESRAVDWEQGKSGATLDDADLDVIEKGQFGMRAWRPDEARLVQVSHAAQEQRKAEQQRLQQDAINAERREQAERDKRITADARAEQEQKNAGKLRRRAVWAGVAAAAALILAIIAGYLFNDARIARETAEANAQVAVVAKSTAEINEQQAKVAEATAVAAQAEAEAAKAQVERLTRGIRADQLTGKALNLVDENPPLALLLAAEGMRAQSDYTTTATLTDPVSPQSPAPITRTTIVSEAVVSSAQSNVHELLGLVGGVPLAGHEPAVEAVAFSPDGRWLATESSDNTVRLWTWQIDDLLAVACRFAARNLTVEEWARYFQDNKEYRKTCPQWPVDPSVTEPLRDDADALAQQGDVVGAITKYKELLALEPSLTIEPPLQAQIEWVKGLLDSGAYTEGLAGLVTAQTMSPTLDITYTLHAYHWRALCWGGSLAGLAAEVMPACERAVALEPIISEGRDGRGLARALTGDLEGSRKDFEVSVWWAGRSLFDATYIEARTAWIAALQAGENPFDAATLERLRNE